jgi:hypothetical protein
METVTIDPPSRSRWWRLVCQTPILRDYINARADTHGDEVSVTDILKVALPTLLATLLTASEQLTKFLAFLPNASRIIQALAPTACAILCVHVVISHKAATPSRRPGFDAEKPKKCSIYKYSESSRLTAKILLPFLIILSPYCLNEVMPNFYGRRVVAGYLCQADGKPVSAREIEVLNVSLRSAEIVPEIGGYDGFFAVQLRTWSGRARVLRIQVEGCKVEDLDVDSSSGSNDHCPAGVADPTRKGDYPIWTVHCLPSA